MKLVSFNCTIELGKDEKGYSDNYYINVDDKGVYISHPYIAQTPEQVMFVTNLVHDFIAQAIDFNKRVDGFNRDNHLEQYAPQVSTDNIPLGTSPDVASEALPESAAPQPPHGTCSNNLNCTDLVAHSDAEQERLDMEQELKELKETTEEDGEAVAYFAEELSKIIDARDKKK